jgi:hypothetical protein
MKAVDEVVDDEPQFSDDEEEQAFLANLRKQCNHDKVKEASVEIPKKRRLGNRHFLLKYFYII